MLYLEEDRLAEAIDSLKKLTNAEPRNAKYRVKLGWAYWLNGNLTKATQEFKKAIDADPWNAQDSNNHLALSLAYQASGMRALSIETLQEGLFASPSMSESYIWVYVEDKNDYAIDPAFAPNGEKSRLNQVIRRVLSLPYDIPGIKQENEPNTIKHTQANEDTRQGRSKPCIR